MVNINNDSYEKDTANSTINCLLWNFKIDKI